MVEIFGTDFSAEIASAFEGQLEAGTLHVITESIDTYGQTQKTSLEHAIEGTVSSWDERTRTARGFPLDAVQIMMIAQGKPRPVKGRDEVTIRGARMSVLDVMDGGAEAVWLIAGVVIDPVSYPATPGGLSPPVTLVAPVYLHQQSVADTTWTINHNLGFRPDVSLTTLGGVEFEADVTHTSDNQCIVTLASPLAGFARCT